MLPALLRLTDERRLLCTTVLTPVVLAVWILADWRVEGVFAPYFDSWRLSQLLWNRAFGRDPISIEFASAQSCLGRWAILLGISFALALATAASRVLVELAKALLRGPASYAREKLRPWSALRAAGNSRLLRTSYFWMFFVPIVAKVFSRLDATPEVYIAGYRLHIDLELPFSWAVFFYSAVAASIANLIYALRCPSLIKRFENPEDFKASGRGKEQLRNEFVTILSRYHKKMTPQEMENNIREFTTQFNRRPASEDELRVVRETKWQGVPLLGRSEIIEDRLSDAFWFIREFADRLYPAARGLCGLLYVIGFILIGWIVLWNIAFVVKFHLCGVC